jgi:hypothetical protein
VTVVVALKLDPVGKVSGMMFALPLLEMVAVYDGVVVLVVTA